MKKEYAAPEVQIEKIAVADIITTSFEDDTGEGGTEIVNPFA